MEIDYLLATALFVAIFAFAVLFVSNNMLEQKEAIRTEIARENADLLISSIFSGNTNISLVSPVYRLYIYAENQNSSSVNELVVLNLDRFGKNDPYSALIVDGNSGYSSIKSSYNYSVAGSNIAFSSVIPGSSAKSFVLYFDDDSNFPQKSSAVEGNNTITETVYGPEKTYVVQNKLMKKLGEMNSSGSGFHISVVDRNNSKIFDYGPAAEGRKNVVIKRKPVWIQMDDASLAEGWVIVNSWS